MNDLADLRAVRSELEGAVASERFSRVRARLAELRVDDRSLQGVLTRVTHGATGQDELMRLRRNVAGGDSPDLLALFPRYALLRAALPALDDLPNVPVDDRVKQYILDEFRWLTHPRDRELAWLEPGSYVFSALCKIVTLRRFPAGQLHWEIDGLPRSSLWRVRRRDLPRLVRGIRQLGGFGPALVPHLAWRRRQIVLSEREHYRSLCRMASSLSLQPAIRGFVAEAWFYSPDTPQVSPHLAWAPRLFERWGGTTVVVGRAGESSGVFENSRTRQERASSGQFHPTLGLVIWPRAAMQRWAAQVDLETAPDLAGTTVG